MRQQSVIIRNIDWAQVLEKAVLGVLCHRSSSLILTEPPCLAELERIQLQEAAKKKPGKCILSQGDFEVQDTIYGRLKKPYTWVETPFPNSDHFKSV